MRRKQTRRARNFFKTPKGLLTIILVIFVVMAAPGEGLRAVATGLGERDASPRAWWTR